MKMQYTKKQILEAIIYWKKQLKNIDESIHNQIDADKIYFDELLMDNAKVEFAIDIKDAIDSRKIAYEYTLDTESIQKLVSFVESIGTQKKVYIYGSSCPEAYSIETAADSYGYNDDDIDKKAQSADEQKYIQNKDDWYSNYLNIQFNKMIPNEIFGIKLEAKPFLLKAFSRNGNTALLCRAIIIN